MTSKPGSLELMPRLESPISFLVPNKINFPLYAVIRRLMCSNNVSACYQNFSVHLLKKQTSKHKTRPQTHKSPNSVLFLSAH